MSKQTELETIAKELYSALNRFTLDCHELSHKKNEYHEYKEECPVVKKIQEAMKQYEDFLENLNKK